MDGKVRKVDKAFLAVSQETGLSKARLCHSSEGEEKETLES
jgi:hypothetical protein